MAQSCPEGKFLDRLVRNCVLCDVLCQNSEILPRCSEYCVALRCKSVPGQFYDRLLRKCLKCSEMCATHPLACFGVCKTPLVPPVGKTPRIVPGRTGPNAAAVTQRPNGVSAVQIITTRGRSTARSDVYSEVLLYSLLGLCIAVLMFTLTAAMLILLKRAKGHQQDNQQPNKHGQSSKDSLMARGDDVSQEGSINQDRPKATETCVYCFSDHTRTPHMVYQQAGPQHSAPSACQDNRHHDNHYRDNGPLNHPANVNYDKTRSFRIICSPTQTST